MRKCLNRFKKRSGSKMPLIRTSSWVSERGNFLFVGLQLLKGFANRGCFVSRIFEFNEPKWQPVHKNNDIGATVTIVFDDGKLIDRQPIVFIRIVEIDKPHFVMNGLSIGCSIFNVDSFG